MPAGHQVAGGLVAGDGQQEEEQLQLQVGQLLPVEVDVVRTVIRSSCRSARLLGVQLRGVGVQLHRGLGGLLGGDGELGVLAADHLVGPVEDPVTVSRGTPSSSAMTISGSSATTSVTKSARPASMTLVDDFVGGLVDPLLEPGDHPGGEALVDQPPVPGVQRRVHVEHHQLLLGQILGRKVPDEDGLPGGREHLEVPVDGHAIVVPGHGPVPGPAERLGCQTTPRRRNSAKRASGMDCTKLAESAKSRSGPVTGANVGAAGRNVNAKSTDAPRLRSPSLTREGSIS